MSSVGYEGRRTIPFCPGDLVKLRYICLARPYPGTLRSDGSFSLMTNIVSTPRRHPLIVIGRLNHRHVAAINDANSYAEHSFVVWLWCLGNEGVFAVDERDLEFMHVHGEP